MRSPSSPKQKNNGPPQGQPDTLSMSIADIVLNPKSYSALLEAESGSRAASESESEEQARSSTGENPTPEPRPSTHRAPPPPPPATSIADLVLDNTIPYLPAQG
ncbi:hypothetical protein LshimejAT787_0410500 [Lyophyllum shimeji]|uniref:Uncharacterized protein n=1 Tax=Lyophyllum shimeji TaxID=47721 RepID=A0A9P3PM50_LYOSH|nr:hypothetical protein LshimejAT787_0410500 [Lyophyllum shimeji]